MLINKKLLFKSGTILTGSMLEHLYEHPLSLTKVFWGDLTDGIIKGFDLYYNSSNKLSVKKGIIKYNKDFYIMDEDKEEILDLNVLKEGVGYIIAFIKLKPQKDSGVESNKMELKIIKEKDGTSDFFEIGRFIHRKSISIKTNYEKTSQFKDPNYIDITRVKYSNIGGSFISPLIFKVFAQEVLQQKHCNDNFLQFTFLAKAINGDFISTDLIKAAFQLNDNEMHSEKILQKLYDFLDSPKLKNDHIAQNSSNNKSIDSKEPRYWRETTK
jgi:hypothetical protein